ncbi:hypothetical protein [Paenibacillus rigui]|uniref:Uncharacterized protein n=1 Tax=Paenibacillus rigui TaxID=554312 RepID=A0A229UKU1_9BACL|nr:hypothetical protein [Paenibacillus rigui]OXM84003.1 hypothetical protein CF651_23105 [Paenibacillus rigui]
MTKQQFIQYLRDQADYIKQMANDIENGVEPQYWTVDLPIPEYEQEREMQTAAREFNWKYDKEIEAESA